MKLKVEVEDSSQRGVGGWRKKTGQFKKSFYVFLFKMYKKNLKQK